MSLCRSCGEPIRWARSATSGKPVPLDPDPVEDGNIRLGRDDDGEVAIYIRKGESVVARDRYISHFVTCPNAAEHRRR